MLTVVCIFNNKSMNHIKKKCMNQIGDCELIISKDKKLEMNVSPGPNHSLSPPFSRPRVNSSQTPPSPPSPSSRSPPGQSQYQVLPSSLGNCTIRLGDSRSCSKQQRLSGG